MKTVAWLVAVSALPAVAAAQGSPQPTFLAIAEAIRKVADGEPWNASLPGGRKARITLKEDRSGMLEEPIPMPITWTVKEAEVCVNFRMAGGTKCYRFVAIVNGFEAYRAGELDLTLTR